MVSTAVFAEEFLNGVLYAARKANDRDARHFPEQFYGNGACDFDGFFSSLRNLALKPISVSLKRSAFANECPSHFRGWSAAQTVDALRKPETRSTVFGCSELRVTSSPAHNRRLAGEQ